MNNFSTVSDNVDLFKSLLFDEYNENRHDNHKNLSLRNELRGDL
jgi:hypothetical protein